MNVAIIGQRFVNVVIREGLVTINVRKNKDQLALVGQALSYD